MTKYEKTEWIPSNATLTELILGGILLITLVTATAVGMLFALALVVMHIIMYFSKESRVERSIKKERREHLAYAQCILSNATSESLLRSQVVKTSDYRLIRDRIESFCWFDSFEDYSKNFGKEGNMLSYIPSAKINGAYWVKLWNGKAGLIDSNGKRIGLISMEWDRRLKIIEPVVTEFNSTLVFAMIEVEKLATERGHIPNAN